MSTCARKHEERFRWPDPPGHKVISAHTNSAVCVAVRCSRSWVPAFPDWELGQQTQSDVKLKPYLKVEKSPCGLATKASADALYPAADHLGDPARWLLLPWWWRRTVNEYMSK